MNFLPMDMLLGKIMYPSGMTDTDVDVYYPRVGNTRRKTSQPKCLTHFSPYGP